MESIFPSKFNCVNQICKSIKIGAMVPQFLSLIEGYSINEVIEIDEKATGRKAVMEYTDRRLGTLARLAASPHLRITWLKSGIFVGTNHRKCVEMASAERTMIRPPLGGAVYL